MKKYFIFVISLLTLCTSCSEKLDVPSESIPTNVVAWSPSSTYNYYGGLYTSGKFSTESLTGQVSIAEGDYIDIIIENDIFVTDKNCSTLVVRFYDNESIQDLLEVLAIKIDGRYLRIVTRPFISKVVDWASKFKVEIDLPIYSDGGSRTETIILQDIPV